MGQSVSTGLTSITGNVSVSTNAPSPTTFNVKTAARIATNTGTIHTTTAGVTTYIIGYALSSSVSSSGAGITAGLNAGATQIATTVNTDGTYGQSTVAVMFPSGMAIQVPPSTAITHSCGGGRSNAIIYYYEA